MINAAILRVILEDLPRMFDTIKDELVAMMDERFRTIQSDLEASRPRTREVTFCEFCARGAPDFSGKKEPIFSM